MAEHMKILVIIGGVSFAVLVGSIIGFVLAILGLPKDQR